jgi:hypothetical protein
LPPGGSCESSARTSGQFDTAGELIWTADGARFPEYLVDGNFIAYHHAADRFFEIRFGTRGGERAGRGDLVIAESDVPVPGR